MNLGGKRLFLDRVINFTTCDTSSTKVATNILFTTRVAFINEVITNWEKGIDLPSSFGAIPGLLNLSTCIRWCEECLLSRIEIANELTRRWWAGESMVPTCAAARFLGIEFPLGKYWKEKYFGKRLMFILRSLVRRYFARYFPHLFSSYQCAYCSTHAVLSRFVFLFCSRL